MTIATLIEDKNCRGTFRVEAIIEDGAVEVAIFSGPNALARAIFFVENPTPGYYDIWEDPEGWSERYSLPSKGDAE